MNITKQFKNGLNIGLNSFSLLWKHKQLLLYLGAPVLVGIAFELIIYNLFFYSPSNYAIFARGIMVRIWETFGWTKHIGLFLTQMIKLFIIIFLSVALTDHVMRIMKRRVSSIKQSVNVSLSKIKLILIWSVASTFFFILINQVDSIIDTSTQIPCYILAIIISLLSRTIWSLATIFIIPAITLEKLSLKQIITLSTNVTKKFLIQYLGAISWICLIGVLTFAPFLLIPLKSQLFQTIKYASLALIGCIISTTHSILKTDLYLKFK